MSSTPTLASLSSEPKLISPVGASFSNLGRDNPNSLPSPSNSNPWKITSPTFNCDAVAMTPPKKSFKDIMSEEKQCHDMQQLKDKEERKFNLCDNKEAKKTNRFHSKQKQHYHRSTNNHHNNDDDNYQNKNRGGLLQNRNRKNSRCNTRQLAQPATSWQPTKNKYRINANNRKKMRNNTSKTHAEKSRHQDRHFICHKENHENKSIRNLVPFLSDMSLMNASNSHEVSYAMMSCKEYYEATTYRDITPKNITKHERTSIISLDCEMVGVGELGERSVLARVCIINWDHEILLDTYVKVDEKVTDYRTFVSGVRDADIQSDAAMDFMQCRDMVRRILKGKILVGHGLGNDLSALCITHPQNAIRDTAQYPLFMTATLVSPIMINRGSNECTSPLSPYSLAPSAIESDCSSTTSSSTISSHELHHPNSENHPSPMMQLKPRRLKEIARERIGISIQKTGEEHSPLEDAYAALELYKTIRDQWEK